MTVKHYLPFSILRRSSKWREWKGVRQCWSGIQFAWRASSRRLPPRPQRLWTRCRPSGSGRWWWPAGAGWACRRSNRSSSRDKSCHYKFLKNFCRKQCYQIGQNFATLVIFQIFLTNFGRFVYICNFLICFANFRTTAPILIAVKY